MQRKLAFGAPLFKFWLVLRCKCSDVLISLSKASFSLCGAGLWSPELQNRVCCQLEQPSQQQCGVMKRTVHLCTHGVIHDRSFSSS